MEVLVAAHGTVRVGVLAAALAVLVAVAAGKGPSRGARISGAVFVGLLDLQLVLGLILVVTAGRAWRDSLVHGVIMLAAIATAHVMRAASKRTANPGRTRLALDVVAPLALVFLGLRFLGP